MAETKVTKNEIETVTGSNIDLTTAMGVITGSASVGTSFAQIGNSLDLVIPAGCNYVLVIGNLRMSNAATTLADFSARILYENTTGYLTVDLTNAGQFHGATCPINGLIPVTPGTRNFKLQGMRSASTGSIATKGGIWIIPLR